MIIVRNCRSFLIGCVLLLLIGGVAHAEQAQPLGSITYRLSMSQPASHLFDVTIEVEFRPDQVPQSIDLQMAKWSPGRYAVFDFAKNVQEFQAAGGICQTGQLCKRPALTVERVNDQTWRVTTLNNRALTINYKVFGNDLSGTFSQLNTKHANFNGGNLFMYVVDHKQDPTRLIIDPPKGWRIGNGRMDRADQREWNFPNWDVMIDTPTEIGPDWTQDDFQVDGKQYHVVVHSLGDEGSKRPALVKDIEKIVRAETAMWGPPEFDSYTFLIHFAGDGHSGDGMEHLTSTQIIEPGVLAEARTYQGVLGTVAHEFFHVWNVKRLRPLGLGPWDFTRPANTRGLWVAEGFTNYYGHLMLRRAGLWDESHFLGRESETITNIETAPGSKLMSAEEASLTAPFIDDAPHTQQTNLENSSISYYPKGELVGMVLDLLIRGKSGGKVSLDDVMKRMYEQFYVKGRNDSYYLHGQQYTIEDLERVASEVAGFDLHDYFQRYARSPAQLPYDEAFGYVGLRLVRQPRHEPYNAGIWTTDETPPGIANIVTGSPAEQAGLEEGDEIQSIGGKPVTPQGWYTVLARFKQGDRVPIVVKRDGRTIQAALVLGAPDRFEYKLEENPAATADQKALRAAWVSH